MYKPNKKDRIVCFTTTAVMVEALEKLLVASTYDSRSSLLRSIIENYLDRLQPDPATEK